MQDEFSKAAIGGTSVTRTCAAVRKSHVSVQARHRMSFRTTIGAGRLRFCCTNRFCRRLHSCIVTAATILLVMGCIPIASSSVQNAHGGQANSMSDNPKDDGHGAIHLLDSPAQVIQPDAIAPRGLAVASPIRIAYLVEEVEYFFEEKDLLPYFVSLFQQSVDMFSETLSVANSTRREADSPGCAEICGFFSSDVLVQSDLTIRVTVRAEGSCPGGTAAYSAPCCRDDTDRPTAGVIWLCPYLRDLVASAKKGSSREEHMAKMLFAHEIIHILGFDVNSFSYYRNPDGSPRVSLRNLFSFLPT